MGRSLWLSEGARRVGRVRNTPSERRYQEEGEEEALNKSGVLGHYLFGNYILDSRN
jgi:hypothetical protein